MYFTATNDEASFFEMINCLVDKDFSNPKIEEFINAMVLLQAPDDILASTEHYNIYSSINLIKPDHKPAIVAPEFRLSFVFKLDELSNAISKICKDNKMIRLGNHIHTIIFTQIHIDYIYEEDGTSSSGAKKVASAAACQSFGHGCGRRHPIRMMGPRIIS